MNLVQRISLLSRLGQYMQQHDDPWEEAKQKAFEQNRWFIPEFIELAVHNIATSYLQSSQLKAMAEKYALPDVRQSPKKVGLVMAGNIPLVGFHDLLCIFLSGHRAFVKLSSKDEVLIKHLVEKLKEWDELVDQFVTIAEMIRNCDAYIATGSNNSSRYFEYYFGRYPNIIRRNRTSVALLNGQETTEQLEKLADDVFQYFGLGCRNVTKLMVPKNYDFVPLLNALRKYNYLSDHHKYKNNYDYNLAIHVLNRQYYMSNENILLVENESPFSPIGQLHFEYYDNENNAWNQLKNDQNIQCVVGSGAIDFGNAQRPDICDYADGVDTMDFLVRLDN